MAYYQKLDNMEYDGLISGVSPAPIVAGKTIRKLGAEAEIVRGTVLAKSSKDDKLVVLGNAAATAEQKFSGDGVAIAFAITAKPARVLGVKVGAADVTEFDYDASTGVLTLTEADEQTFNGNNSTVSFVVTAAPAALLGIKVGGVDVYNYTYAPATGTITFAAAPATGTGNIVVAYVSAPAVGTNNVVVTYPDEELVPDCILCDPVTVGTANDVNVAAYIAGCFNPDKLTVKSGYTLTEGDKDKLRERGIILVEPSAI